MTVSVRETPTVSRYARLPAEGFAVEPDLDDPTGVLAAAFADLASPLVADGVRRYYLLHPALPRLSEALSNLGFGRNGAYGVQAAVPRRRSPAVAVRVAGPEDLATVARLALVELQHRSADVRPGPGAASSRAGRRAPHLARQRRRPPPGRPRRRRRRPAHHRADLTGTAPVPGRPALHRPHRHHARRPRPGGRARAGR